MFDSTLSTTTLENTPRYPLYPRAIITKYKINTHNIPTKIPRTLSANFIIGRFEINIGHNNEKHSLKRPRFAWRINQPAIINSKSCWKCGRIQNQFPIRHKKRLQKRNKICIHCNHKGSHNQCGKIFQLLKSHGIISASIASFFFVIKLQELIAFL